MICGFGVRTDAIRPSTGRCSLTCLRHLASSATQRSFFASSRADRFSYSFRADWPASSRGETTTNDGCDSSGHTGRTGASVAPFDDGGSLAAVGPPTSMVWHSTHRTTRSVRIQCAVVPASSLVPHIAHRSSRRISIRLSIERLSVGDGPIMKAGSGPDRSHSSPNNLRARAEYDTPMATRLAQPTLSTAA